MRAGVFFFAGLLVRGFPLVFVIAEAAQVLAISPAELSTRRSLPFALAVDDPLLMDFNKKCRAYERLINKRNWTAADDE